MVPYSKKEELFNWLTHGIATVASLAGILLLCSNVSPESGAVVWISIAVYSASLLILYSASTLYHWINAPKWKHIFRIIDHSAIYVKIAGTYTPFLLLALRDNFGWELLMIMWTLTVIGILLKFFFVKRFNLLSTVIYLAMGWLILLLIKPLYRTLPFDVFFYLLAGGISFTAGVSFYLWKKLPYSHSIWHMFVIGGSSFHFISIYLYLAR